ncbi:MAG: hypothetical protein AAGJ46_00690 [Planctomycetota bacterium]
MMRWIRSTPAAIGCAALLCCGVLGSNSRAQAVIFADDLSDNTNGWQFNAFDAPFFGTLGEALDAIGGGTRVGSLGTAGYDYSADGIPEAPNSDPTSTATTGFRMITNILDGGEPQIDGETVAEDQARFFIENPGFTGRYTVQVDMWLNFSQAASLAGTTEFGGLFVGQETDSNPINPRFPASEGAGAIFSTDGDCGNCDFILLKNEAELDLFSGQYSVSDFGFGNQPGWDNTDVNDDPNNGILIDLPALFPAQNSIQQAGSVAGRWLTLTAVVDPDAPGLGDNGSTGTATFSLEFEDVANPGETTSFVLGTVDNSVDDDPNDGFDTGESPIDLTGKISLALIDFFPSLAQNVTEAFALYDNVLVFETPVEAIAGDFNEDGFVDAADYTVWRDSFETGDLDLTDYADWKANFGMGMPPEASTGSIPEPTALVLALIPMLGIGRRR